MKLVTKHIKSKHYLELACLIDNALPECKWKRLFATLCIDKGLEVAYAKWRAGPIVNTQYLTRIDELIEEIKSDYAARFPGQ